MVWNLCPFKGYLVWGKARSHRVPNLGCRRAESLGWFDVSPNNSEGDVMYEWACCRDEAANHQSTIAVAFWIIQIVSVEECSSLMQNLRQIHCSACSVILNVVATQYTCSLNSVYHPHWRGQWSHHCSRMHIPVHSPWLPGYIDVEQTVFIILTMAELFLDRLCTCVYVNICMYIHNTQSIHIHIYIQMVPNFWLFGLKIFQLHDGVQAIHIQ